MSSYKKVLRVLDPVVSVGVSIKFGCSFATWILYSA